ncbi:UDP-N-acetyl-D-mannosamine dehydrogenase [Novosphingobium tardum]|uniref:UDP-N-acetyl-D-mannosamine dehydrogenase n=1 Tax=Novosphingobium tardum TaxID=1538021 RepID=A0ABV8RKR6_9SPHN
MTVELPAVAMIGLGYIGLPTAAVVARSGCRVVGIDVSSRVVETINRGRIHIEEADLDALVRDVVARGLLQASLSVVPADVFVIAVPTPTGEGHAPDIDHVLAAARSIAPVLRKGNLVILESTSPIGTTEKVRDVLALERPDLAFPRPGSDGADVSLAYCPERVLPGHILAELVGNDRVIGGMTPACSAQAREFYKRFVEGDCVVTDCRSAEMTKLVENAFRDVNIAFANELSLLADALDMDVWEVIRLANRHPRVNILQPGPGVGGHCIAVDPWFLVHSAPEQTPLIRTARNVNDGKVGHVVERATAMIEESKGPIACFGLAFKADIDDFRESPALAVAERLADRFGERMLICEPFISELPETLAGRGARLATATQALEQASVALLLVDHSEFRGISAAQLAGKRIYDTRGVWPRLPLDG